MKKILALASAVAIAFTLSACSAPEDAPSKAAESGPAPVVQENKEVKKEKVEKKAEEAQVGTVGQQNALKSAEGYLAFSPFSHKGLAGQLAFEDYTDADIEWAMKNLDSPDWNAQAAKSAENYLSFSSFSRSGLIDQLVFEGFTKSQAAHGADSVGL